MYKTNWYEKDPEKALDIIYEELEDDSSRYDFFKYLMKNYPDLDIEWLETFEDMKEYLMEQERIEDILAFVGWYKTKNAQDYSERYEFIESDLCNYYLFQNDPPALLERIEFIKQNPVSAIDTLTVRLLFQLIYHGLYKEAVDFAGSVWKPIAESDEVIGLAEYEFVNTIYINELQKFYESFLSDKTVDAGQVFEKAREMGFSEDKDLMKEVVDAITSDLDFELVSKSIREKRDNHMLHLNIQFLKYMYEKYELPFFFSELFWQFVATLKIFGKHGKENWFFVDAKTMDKHIASKTDFFYSSNIIQVFGQVWGFDYIIDFFGHFNLINKEQALIMNENNLHFKNEMIRIIGDDLWKVNFVFKWPKIKHALAPILDLKHFNQTFKNTGFKDDIVEEIISLIPINERIRKELQLDKKKNMEFDVEPAETYIKSGPDIGRNDPCPCGSGKKYKKCCMN